MKKSLILILGLGLIATGLSGSAQPEEICNVLLTPEDSIQNALDAATGGDTICLEAGDWNEHVVIDVAINLVGSTDGESVIEGVLEEDPVITIEEISSLINLVITHSEGDCDDPSQCSIGVLIENDADVGFLDSAIRSNRGFGVVLQDRAAAEFANTVISSNGLGGISLRDESEVLLINAFVEENGSDPFCLLPDVFCSGVEVMHNAELVVDGAEINNNADWGIGAALERCGYAVNQYAGSISVEGDLNNVENNLAHNLDDLGNPGIYGLTHLAAGQICTQELFITNVQPRTGSEFIEIANLSRAAINLGGVEVTVTGENVNNTYVIPDECTLDSYSSLRILSGPASFATATVSCASEQNSHFWQGSFSIPNNEFEISLTSAEGEVLDQLTLPENRPIVVVKTNLGTFKVVLFKDLAPITTENFEMLVRNDFYNGLIYHRIIDNFVIQGGDPTCILGEGPCGAGGTDETIPLEIAPSLKHSQSGMVAMARTPDPDSASSQYYISLEPLSRLDGSYAVFGRVIDNIELVLRIGQVETGERDRPLKDVVMQEVFIDDPFERFELWRLFLQDM